MKTYLVVFLLLFTGLYPVTTISQTYKPAENYGGKQQLRDFIKEELVYPDKARADLTEGTVILGYTIRWNGSIENLHVSTPVSPEIDAEALRLFRMLLWEPAESQGLKVDENGQMEFEFRLKKYERFVHSRRYDHITFTGGTIDTSLRIFEIAQVDQSPKPVYDEKGMNFGSFIMKNMKYPEAAIKQSISGVVELFFVVEPSGRVSNVKVVKGIGAGCNQEAIRLLKLLKWSPGLKNKMAVRTSMKLSFTFNLKDFENQRYVPASNNNQI